jgi:hypothetical protein
LCHFLSRGVKIIFCIFVETNIKAMMIIIFLFLCIICSVIIFFNSYPETETQKVQRKYKLSDATLDELIYKHEILKQRYNSDITLCEFIKLITKEDGKTNKAKKVRRYI